MTEPDPTAAALEAPAKALPSPKDSPSPPKGSGGKSPSSTGGGGDDAADAIEAATESDARESDEFDLADGWDTQSARSTSASSSVYAHTYEHGRRYQHFKNGRYPIPNDDLEQSREDMKHAMLLELTDGVLFYAPVGDNPQLILDIGTGTGIWAIEVGDRYPSARVRGIDLSPIQPVWVPANVDFLVDDCEEEWLDRDVDLVHLRFTIIMIKDEVNLFRNAFKSLRPGGWIELQELLAMPMCDDGTMPDDDPVKTMYEITIRAFEKFNMDTLVAAKLEPMLRDAGFVNIQCIVKKVPIGVWAKDKTLRLIGLYQRMAVLDVLPAIGGRPFAALGMSAAEIEVTLAMARKALHDDSVHRYFNYYFWFAQKPTDG